jgi:hypothetical protein
MQFLFTGLPWMAPQVDGLHWLLLGAALVSLARWIQHEARG